MALDEAFAALADPTRRDIVARLALVEDASVTDLAEPYDVSIQAVSKHVGVLERAGLVHRTRRGRERPVHLDAEVLSLMSGWLERRRREVEGRYSRLDAVLADMDAQEDNR